MERAKIKYIKECSRKLKMWRWKKVKTIRNGQSLIHSNNTLNIVLFLEANSFPAVLGIVYNLE